MRKIIKKSVIFFSYVIYFLIIFEILLFFSGKLLTSTRDSDIKYQNKSVILTMGDSFTYGAHVGHDETYPFLLDKLLGQNYKVINKGLSGSNSSYIVKNIENHIKNYKPHMVLILSGANNYSNFEGLYSEGGFFEKVKSFFLKRRIYRLYFNLFKKNRNYSYNVTDDKNRLEQEYKIFELDLDKHLNVNLKTEILNSIPEPEYVYNKFKNKKNTSLLNLRKLNTSEKGQKLLNNYNFSEADKFFSDCITCDNKSFLYAVLTKIFMYKDFEALDLINSFFDDFMLNQSIYVLKNVINYRINSNVTLNVEKIIEEIKRNNVVDTSLFIRITEIYLKNNDFINALNWIDTGIKLFPEDGLLYLYKGLIYFEQNNFLEAARIFSKGIEIQPDYPDNYLFMAETQAALGNVEGFREYYEKGEQIAPLYNEVYFSRAFTLNRYYKQKENFKDISFLLKTGISKNPHLFIIDNAVSKIHFDNIILVLETFYFINEIEYLRNIVEKIFDKLSLRQQKKLLERIPVLIENYELNNDFFIDYNYKNLEYYEVINDIKEKIQFIEYLIADWKLEKALEYCIQLKNNVPENLRFLIYPSLINIYLLNGDYSKALDYLIIHKNYASEENYQIIDNTIELFAVVANRYDVLAKIKKENNIFIEFLSGENFHQNINKWILEDCKKIIEICKKNKVIPVFMNYFENDMKFLKDFCVKNNIKFIDNYNFFQNYKLKNPEENFDKYFVPDRHLSEKGNRLKSEYIYNELLKILK